MYFFCEELKDLLSADFTFPDYLYFREKFKSLVPCLKLR